MLVAVASTGAGRPRLTGPVAGPVDAAQCVFDPTGVDVLRLVLLLVVLEAQTVALLEDEELAGVAVCVGEPALLAPRLRDDLYVFRGSDERLSAVGCGITGAGV